MVEVVTTPGSPDRPPADATLSLERVWCCVPVFNNAGTIVDIAMRCREQLANVLVVDDGSTDADLAELLKAIDVAVLRHPTNQGKGAALRSAMEFIAQRGGQFMITLDGDGQHFPEDIPRFFPLLSPDAIVIGRRTDVIGVMPDSSLFGREFSDFWVTVETGWSVPDTQSGFRAYPIESIRKLRLNTRHYNFEVEILTKALWAGLRAHSVDIRVWYPPKEERVSSFRPWDDNLRLSLLHLRLVARQISPHPHRRIQAPGPSPGNKRKVRTWNQWQGLLLRENGSPIGLAAAVGLGLLMGLVLGAVGAGAIIYVALRLHLNKPGFLLSAAATATCSPLRDVCITVGRRMAGPDLPNGLAWIVGAHVVGLPLVLVVAILTYIVARTFDPLRPQINSVAS